MATETVFVFYSNSGAPATGIIPVPTIDITRISDSVPVVTASNMVEVGNGFYKFDFTTFDASEQYGFLADAGVAATVDSRFVPGAVDGSSQQVAETVLSTAVPGSFAAGTLGKLVGDSLDAAVSTRAVPGDAMTLSTAEEDAIVDKVWIEPLADHVGVAGGMAEALNNASATANPTIIADAVWNELIADHAAVSGSFAEFIDFLRVFSKNKQVLTVVSATQTKFEYFNDAGDTVLFTVLVNGTGTGIETRAAAL